MSMNDQDYDRNRELPPIYALRSRATFGSAEEFVTNRINIALGILRSLDPHLPAKYQARLDYINNALRALDRDLLVRRCAHQTIKLRGDHHYCSICSKQIRLQMEGDS